MDTILGQARAVDVLQRQLAAGRSHHAYIFHGPPGVGKFTTALAFAKVLLCHQPQRDLAGRIIACDSCPSCRLAAERGGARGAEPSPNPQESRLKTQDSSGASGASGGFGAHPDLHVVTKELAQYSDDPQVRARKLTSIPVVVLRSALIEPVYRAAQMSHGKVFIVDEAELLNLTGQNLLLKTLEEPPAGTTIILVTASESQLLPTIRSRCQRIAFVPLPEEVVGPWVAEHAAQWIEPDRRWLTRFADGSLGRAQLALDYNLAQWAHAVLPVLDQLGQGKVRGSLGEYLADRIKAFAEAWVERHTGASKEAANRMAADLMWSLIAGHARAQLARLAQQLQHADVFEQEAAFEPWLNVIDALSEAERLLSRNVNLTIVCDYLVTMMSPANV